MSNFNPLVVLKHLSKCRMEVSELRLVSTKLFNAVKVLFPESSTQLLFLYKMSQFMETGKPLKVFFEGECESVFFTDRFKFSAMVLMALRHVESFSKSTDSVAYFLGKMIIHLKMYRPPVTDMLETLNCFIRTHSNHMDIKCCNLILSELSALYLSTYNVAVKRNILQVVNTVLSIWGPYIKSRGNLLELLQSRIISGSSILSLYSQEEIQEAMPEIMAIVVKMMHHNINSREGGLLYKSIVKTMDFSSWLQDIWPLWKLHVERFHLASEFYNNLLKYWIPTNLERFGYDFYKFLDSRKYVKHELKADLLYRIHELGYKKCIDRTQSDYIRAAINIALLPLTHRIGLKLLFNHFDMSYVVTRDIMVFIQTLIADIKNTDDFDYSLIDHIFAHLIFTEHLKKKRDDSYDFEACRKFFKFLLRYAKSCLQNSDKSEVGAKILQSLLHNLTCESTQLNVLYTIQRALSYDKKENNLFLYLQDDEVLNEVLTCPEKYVDLCFKTYVDHEGVPCYTSALISTLITVGALPKLERYINKNNTIISVAALEKRREMLKILLKKKREDYPEQCARECRDHFTKFTAMFKTTAICDNNKRQVWDLLILSENILELSKVGKLSWEICKATGAWIDRVEQICHNVNLEVLSEKMRKIFEALLNNILDIIMRLSSVTVQLVEDVKFFPKLFVIIEKSNMKKTVTKVIDLIKEFGTIMEKNKAHQAIKDRIFDEVLTSVFVGAKYNIRLRKNPETRAVIHALCTSAGSRRKMYIDLALKRLMSFDNTFDGIESALNCIEILILDKSLYDDTHHFVQDIIILSIEVFQQRNWSVRNAAVQLNRGLINRCLGISQEYPICIRSIADVFTMFPKLMSYFYDTLLITTVPEEALMILQYFSESHTSQCLFYFDIVKNTLSYFSTLFMRFLGCVEHLGVDVAYAYASLCPEQNLPKAIESAMKTTYLNYKTVPSSIIIKMMFVIEDLIYRFRRSYHFYLNPTTVANIMREFEDLKELIHLEHPTVLHLIYKYSSDRSLRTKIRLVENMELSYEDKVRMDAYISDIICNLYVRDSSAVLDTMLSTRLPPAFVSSTLMLFTIKLTMYKDERTIEQFLSVLYEKLAQECDESLINLFTSVLLILTKSIAEFDDDSLVVDIVRRSYQQSSNIYKNICYLLVVAKLPSLSATDHIFLCDALYYVSRFNSNNSVTVSKVAQSLKYFKLVIPHDKTLVLIKMVAILLTTGIPDIERDICEFVQLVTGDSVIAHAACFERLFSTSILLKYSSDADYLELYLNDIKNYLRIQTASEESTDTFFYRRNCSVVKYLGILDDLILEIQLKDLKIVNFARNTNQED